MSEPEFEAKRGFFSRVGMGISRGIYALSLLWAVKFVWRTTTYILAWGLRTLSYVIDQLRAYRQNKEIAKKMEFSEFVNRQGLSGESSKETEDNIKKKKKILGIEIALMLIFLAFEVAMIASQLQTLVKIQAGLAIFVIACMLYIRSWNYAVLNNREYIYLPLWLFGLPYLFKHENESD